MLMAVSAIAGQTSSLDELIGRLRQGGYVLVMRHASSPREAPSKDVANADNTKLERQLDEAGRRGATAMGEAIRTLRIPIGIVLTSPTYRAMETVRLARLDSPAAVNELGDGGQSMQGITEAQAAWLRPQCDGDASIGQHHPGDAPAELVACVSRLGILRRRWRNGDPPAGWQGRVCSHRQSSRSNSGRGSA